ncbi:MAG: FeoB-associated Cys-rich membrane protein [Oscillospiraceae bacterium]|nr:FeoB-associated Cys-rich membrane protein [Oscillospiraceae bacterium]
MNVIDVVLLVVIGVAIFGAVRYIAKQKKSGGCIGCSGCSACGKSLKACGKARTAINVSDIHIKRATP